MTTNLPFGYVTDQWTGPSDERDMQDMQDMQAVQASGEDRQSGSPGKQHGQAWASVPPAKSAVFAGAMACHGWQSPHGQFVQQARHSKHLTKEDKIGSPSGQKECTANVLKPTKAAPLEAWTRN